MRTARHESRPVRRAESAPAPFVALQIEYSLVERSVEHELMPMARALGLGVMPCSPLEAVS
jgi:aryl-alcohol dehydrogenase-like predicted oxidoreductase